MNIFQTIKRLRTEWIVLGVSSLSALASLIAQTHYRLAPCPLCKIQRTLHLLLLLGALLSLWRTRFKKLCLALLAASAAVASYHSLVQWGILQDRCRAPLTALSDHNSYLDLLAQKQTGCAKSGWKVVKVPVCVLNAGCCVLLLVVMAYSKKKD